MHTVEIYALAKRVAMTLGYRVREEDLGGVGAGVCEIGGQKSLFIDLAMSPLEQLEVVAAALDRDPGIHQVGVPMEVADRFPSRLLRERRAA